MIAGTSHYAVLTEKSRSRSQIGQALDLRDAIISLADDLYAVVTDRLDCDSDEIQTRYPGW